VRFDHLAERAGPLTPGRVAPVVRTWLRRAAPLLRLAHRPRIDGLENLPASGPFLLVANHPPGFATSELFAFAVFWLERVGEDRPLAGFAHPLAFHVWPVSAVLRRLGAIPSSLAAGKAALESGIPLFVLPGGDHEATLPLWKTRRRANFAGRRGFLELARGAGAPIVPMAIGTGSLITPILWQSTKILPTLAIWPRFVGLRRFPLTVLGLLGAAALLSLPGLGPARWALVWLWLASPLALLPWIPMRIRFRIGRPLPAEVDVADVERAIDSLF
jgi:1-acyl-sn-glycerol-3-phosphate acyltransferase